MSYPLLKRPKNGFLSLVFSILFQYVISFLPINTESKNETKHRFKPKAVDKNTVDNLWLSFD